MLKVRKRGGFSDRNGIKPENTEIQLKDFDERTRVQFVNMISRLYRDVFGGMFYQKEPVQIFFRFIWGEVYSQQVDARKIYDDDVFFKNINETIMKDEYDAVLTLLEVIAGCWDAYLEHRGMRYRYEKFGSQTIYDCMNTVFKQEYVGYRFIDGYISPISDEEEIQAIEGALTNPYHPVREHITKANRLLSDRDKPDYENSIKESISAVEAICEVLTGVQGKEASLGKLLKKLEDNGVVIHSGLKSAFHVLYGYTSNANGIRHAGDIGGPASTFEEAKFMLVACSAFINYLIGVSAGNEKI